MSEDDTPKKVGTISHLPLKVLVVDGSSHTLTRAIVEVLSQAGVEIASEEDVLKLRRYELPEPPLEVYAVARERHLPIGHTNFNKRRKGKIRRW